MRGAILLAKICHCTLTTAKLNSIGSIAIAQTLLDAVGMLFYKQEQVVKAANGQPLFVPVSPAPTDSKARKQDGAGGRLGMKGDRSIIMTCGQITPGECKTHLLSGGTPGGRQPSGENPPLQ